MFQNMFLGGALEPGKVGPAAAQHPGRHSDTCKKSLRYFCARFQVQATTIAAFNPFAQKVSRKKIKNFLKRKSMRDGAPTLGLPFKKAAHVAALPIYKRTHISTFVWLAVYACVCVCVCCLCAAAVLRQHKTPKLKTAANLPSCSTTKNMSSILIISI